MRKCIVVGGGAAGMMAAYSASINGAAVTLFEKNEKLGKKIYITGKGRCNLTNDCEDDFFFSQIVSNPKFMYSAYYSFGPSQLMQLMEENGCLLKVERGNRVFPVSDHSSDVIKAMRHALEKQGVTICYNHEITELLIRDETIYAVKDGNSNIYEADAVIVCTGGLSYSSTGSSGDGYDFAQKAGHTIVPCKPALVPFRVKETWPLSLQGLALKNISVRLHQGKKNIYEGFGEMIFTHFGISGPLILSASSYYVKKYFEKELELVIDLKPALSLEQLDKRLLRDFQERQNKQFKNAIDGLLPSKLISVMIQLSGIDPSKYVHDLTKEERLSFALLLKNLSLTVIGTRDFNEAIITQGGVQIKEINPSTMESKLVKNLYFAGEVLDIDALTGGYNLQIAWSTGYLAGMSASEI